MKLTVSQLRTILFIGAGMVLARIKESTESP